MRCRQFGKRNAGVSSNRISYSLHECFAAVMAAALVLPAMGAVLYKKEERRSQLFGIFPTESRFERRSDSRWHIVDTPVT